MCTTHAFMSAEEGKRPRKQDKRYDSDVGSIADDQVVSAIVKYLSYIVGLMFFRSILYISLDSIL